MIYGNHVIHHGKSGNTINTAESSESAEMTKEESINRITESIIGAAIEVHRALSSGLLESAYDFPDPLCSLRVPR